MFKRGDKVLNATDEICIFAGEVEGINGERLIALKIPGGVHYLAKANSVKPLPAAKPDRVKGLEVDDYGRVWVRVGGGLMALDGKHGLQKETDARLAIFGCTPADILTIRNGIDPDVQKYLNRKPPDAEAKLRVPKKGDVEWSRVDAAWLEVEADWPADDHEPFTLMRGRRWVKSAAPAAVTAQVVEREREKRPTLYGYLSTKPASGYFTVHFYSSMTKAIRWRREGDILITIPGEK